MLYYILYVVYAYIQSVLIMRHDEEETTELQLFIMFTAPLWTIGLIIYGLHRVNKYIITKGIKE